MPYRPALAVLAAALALAACGSSEPDDGVPLTCGAIGGRTDGTFRATAFDSLNVERRVEATCTQASVTADRVVVRGVVLSGALREGEVVVTALGTGPGVYSLTAGQGGAYYAAGGQTYGAVEGSVVLTAVSETAVVGAFDFVSRDGVRLVNGEFSVPRD